MGGVRPLVGVSILMVALLAATATPATAVNPRPTGPIQVVSEEAVYDPKTGNVNFRLTFDRNPDFATADEFGRLADQFQYFIVGDSTLPYPQNFDAIIRVGESSDKPRALTIRDSSPSSDDPGSGGWGAIRAIVPFRLMGRTVAFSAPLSALSDHSTDGNFTYVLETYHFGAFEQQIESRSIVPS